MNNGQTKDLAHAYNGAPIVIMDYSKDKQDYYCNWEGRAGIRLRKYR